MIKKTSNKTDDNSPSTDLKYTSSKANIWKAYKQAIQTLGDHSKTASTKTILDSTKSLDKLSKDLKVDVAALAKTLNSKIEKNIEDLLEQISQAQTALFDLQEAREKQKFLLAEEKQALLKQIAEEKDELLKQKQRLAEDYDYDFEKRKKHQEEELAETKIKIEADLAQRTANLKDEEKELADLRVRVANFQATIDQEVKDAVVAREKELETQFDHQQALAEQKNLGEQSLLKQKNEALLAVTKSQGLELQRLQKNLTELNNKLTNIAEKAVARPELRVARDKINSDE